MTISVIIPVRNEARGLATVLRRVAAGRPRQIIVVDGGSTDGTRAIARACGADVLRAPRGRAAQMNAGAGAATGDVLLFLHGDTLLPERADEHVERTLAPDDVVAGAFPLVIDGHERSLRIIERAVDFRSRSRQMPYGDQGLFLTRRMFESVGGFPNLPVMEDYELVRRLRRRGRLALAGAPVRTSARRWRARGVWRTTLLNQACVAAYRFGVPPRRIASWRDDSAMMEADSRTTEQAARGVAAQRRQA